MNVILAEAAQQETLKTLLQALLPGAALVPLPSQSPMLPTDPVDIAFLGLHKAEDLALAEALRSAHPKANILFCADSREYAMEAWDLNGSAYFLGPITQEKLENALQNLRYPVRIGKRVKIQCFGNFEVYCDGKPIWFKYSRTKELFAYLVDRKGALCSIRELSAILFGDDMHRSYMYQIRLDLINTLDALGVGDIISHPHGCLSLARDKVKCDYFDYLDHRLEPPVREYMTQYSFGEQTCATLFMGR